MKRIVPVLLGLAGIVSVGTGADPAVPVAVRFHEEAVKRGDLKGFVRLVRVKTGLSNGVMTEVTGRDLQEGKKVITGTSSASSGEPKR